MPAMQRLGRLSSSVLVLDTRPFRGRNNKGLPDGGCVTVACTRAQCCGPVLPRTSRKHAPGAHADTQAPAALASHP